MQKIKFFLIFIFFGFSPLLANAEWVKIYDPNGERFYDTNRVASKDGIIYVWEAVNLKPMPWVKEIQPKSSLVRKGYDCKGETIALLETYDYSAPMGKGALLSSKSYLDNLSWKSPPPGSDNEKNLLIFCK